MNQRLPLQYFNFALWGRARRGASTFLSALQTRKSRSAAARARVRPHLHGSRPNAFLVRSLEARCGAKVQRRRITVHRKLARERLLGKNCQLLLLLLLPLSPVDAKVRKRAAPRPLILHAGRPRPFHAAELHLILHAWLNLARARSIASYPALLFLFCPSHTLFPT